MNNFNCEFLVKTVIVTVLSAVVLTEFFESSLNDFNCKFVCCFETVILTVLSSAIVTDLFEAQLRTP